MIIDGTLIYDDVSKRFVALCDNDDTYEFHCGCTLQIKNNREWQETRIEYDGSNDDVFGWYFVGVGRAATYIGHSVKIKL